MFYPVYRLGTVFKCVLSWLLDSNGSWICLERKCGL